MKKQKKKKSKLTISATKNDYLEVFKLKTKFQRIISAFLAMVLLFGVVIVPTYAKPTDYEQAYNEGYTPLTTHEILSKVKTINDAFESLLGFRLISEEKFAVTVNGHLNDIFAGIKEATEGVIDCEELINSLPSLAEGSKKIKALFKLDMEVVGPQMQEMADQYYRDGNPIASFFLTFLKVYLMTIESCEIYLEPVEEGLFEVKFVLNFENGSAYDSGTGIMYDEVNQTLTGADGAGVLGTGFDFDTDDYIITTAVNSWQRGVGFTIAYDIFCYVTEIFDYTTVRVKFVYDNREWMIQLWKGRYLVAPGAEIGIYNREIGAPGTFYNCAGDDDMMVMGMEIYHLDDLIFEMEPTLHWWLTGFKLSPKVYLPESLTMNGTIEFPTQEMADLFVDSAQATGEIEANQNGTLVSFVW